MSLTNQIPDGTLDMIQQEARAVFYGVSGDEKTVLRRRAVDATVQHALEHALEEGVVEIPQDLKRGEAIMAETPEAGILRHIRRQTQIGRLHDELAVAMSETPPEWTALAQEYSENGTVEAAKRLVSLILAGRMA